VRAKANDLFSAIPKDWAGRWRWAWDKGLLNERLLLSWAWSLRLVLWKSMESAYRLCVNVLREEPSVWFVPG